MGRDSDQGGMSTSLLLAVLQRMQRQAAQYRVKAQDPPAVVGRIGKNIEDANAIKAVAAMIERDINRDIDSVALDVSRRFTPDNDPQRRAKLQCAVIETINQDRVTLRWDEENHATALVEVVEVLGLDLPCTQDQTIKAIRGLIAERDALRAALVEILEYRGGADSALDDEYVIERARGALAIGDAKGGAA